MKRDREIHRQVPLGQLQNARNNSNGADCDVSRGNSHVIVEPNDGFVNCGLIGKWLTHAHVDHVAYAAVTVECVSRSAGNLFKDLTWRKLPIETRLPGRAKRTVHRATCLRAHANSCAIAVKHQHRFNQIAAGRELPKEFDRVTGIRGALRNEFKRYRKLLLNFRAQHFWKCGHGLGKQELLIQ